VVFTPPRLAWLVARAVVVDTTLRLEHQINLLFQMELHMDLLEEQTFQQQSLAAAAEPEVLEGLPMEMVEMVALEGSGLMDSTTLAAAAAALGMLAELEMVELVAVAVETNPTPAVALP